MDAVLCFQLSATAYLPCFQMRVVLMLASLAAAAAAPVVNITSPEGYLMGIDVRMGLPSVRFPLSLL
jgi:hypothetical protein